MTTIVAGMSAGISARAFSPIQIPNMTCWLSTSDAIVTFSNIVTSITDRKNSLVFSANPTQVQYTANDSMLGGRPSCTTFSELGFTFSTNIVPSGSARTVVSIGRCSSNGGVTLLQMSGENTHRVAFVRLNIGGYLAASGAANLVIGTSGPVSTAAKCTIWTMSSTRDITCDEGTGNLVKSGSPLATDDTGSTAAGGSLLASIPGLFGAQLYSLAELLVYSRVLNATEISSLRKYSNNLYGTT